MEQVTEKPHLYANGRLTHFKNGVEIHGANRAITLMITADSSLIIRVRRTIDPKHLGATPLIKACGFKFADGVPDFPVSPCFAFTRAGITVVESHMIMSHDSSEALHGALDMVLRGMERGVYKPDENIKILETDND